jgi:hypothetical protein
MNEIGMRGFAREQGDGFAVRADGPVRTRPSMGNFRAGEHARKRGWPASTRRFIQARRAHRFGNVENAALDVPALAQPDADSKIAPRALRAVDNDIFYRFRRSELEARCSDMVGSQALFEIDCIKIDLATKGAAATVRSNRRNMRRRRQ